MYDFKYSKRTYKVSSTLNTKYLYFYWIEIIRQLTSKLTISLNFFSSTFDTKTYTKYLYLSSKYNKYMYLQR